MEELASLGLLMMWIGLLEVRLSTEDIIRKSLKCLDIEPWQSKQRGDKIIVTASRWTAEITGHQYDKEAVAKYLAAVSPENIAELLAVIDGLRGEIEAMRAAKDYSLSEDIQRDLVRLAYRVSIEINKMERENDKETIE